MKSMEGYTIEEMAKLTGKKYKAVAQIILRAEHEPIFSGNIYSVETLELVKNTPGKGRPKKAKQPEN
jgi:hypothetical protein